MRRTLFFLIILGLCVSFYHLAIAFPKGIPLSDYEFRDTELALSKPILKELVFLPTSSFEEKDAIKMIKNLEKVDGNILYLAAKESIQIKLFTGSLTNQPGLSSLKSSKPRGYDETDSYWDKVPGMSDNRVVYAKIGHSEFGNGHGSVSLELHEFAHAIDRHVFHYIRLDPVFINIWKQEVKWLFPFRDYFINFPEEYFAETFAMFYHNDETHDFLKQEAPLTFKYIQSLEKIAAEQVNNSYYGQADY